VYNELQIIFSPALILARSFLYEQANNKNTEEDLKMKKTLSTLILSAVVVLITATFSFAEYAAAGAGNFPFFHLGALIVGGMTIVSLKQKYQKLYLSEAVGSFAMYAVLVALCTSPVAEAIKNLM
jgi:FtsH-binding integral membrane protein